MNSAARTPGGPRRPGRRARLLVRFAAGAFALVVVAAGLVDAHSKAGNSAGPRERLHIVVPAAPGGGWDTVARELQAVIDQHGFAGTTEVVNIPGAGGTIGLSRLVNQTGKADTLMMTGTVMMGSIKAVGSPSSLRDVTPIARLADDYPVLAVPADSPFRDIDDVLAAWRSDPSSVVVGGGSVGGTDQLLGGMLAEAGGADPKKLNYVAYAGGGEAVAGMLNGSLDVGVSGYDEFAAQIETGELRALGISSGRRLPGVDIPTFREQGVDVELANWRGLVAPPGLSAEQRAELSRLVREIHATRQWQDTLRTNEWVDTFQTGSRFQRFVDVETGRIDRISEGLGLS